MKMHAYAAISLLALAAWGPALAKETPYCPVQGPAVLALGYDQFNGSAGWRLWGENGCVAEGAALISGYRALHASTLDADRTASLQWHEAQLRAAIGDYPGAVTLIRVILATDDGDADYHLATLAFLSSDLPGLIAARDRMKALPEPEEFAAAADAYVLKYKLPRPVWPMNLDVVEDLIRCFDQPYAVAYARCLKQ